MNDQKNIFEDHWETRSGAYDLLSEDDIRDILTYTKQKLNELKEYCDTFKGNKKAERNLIFYKDYVELLLRYHENNFGIHPGTYMFFYSELLLGSQRYLTIKDELKKLNPDIKI